MTYFCGGEIFLSKKMNKQAWNCLDNLNMLYYSGEHPFPSLVSVKLHCNFIEIKLRYGCSLLNLLHISRAPFPKTHLWRAAFGNLYFIPLKFHWRLYRAHSNNLKEMWLQNISRRYFSNWICIIYLLIWYISKSILFHMFQTRLEYRSYSSIFWGLRVRYLWY